MTSDDSERVTWRIGSFCDTSACVEVGFGAGEVRVRRARTDGPDVVFSKEEWAAFLQSAKAGEFDL
ncbi:DUF397 domain-containing protein [Catellatospora bangladeshensis]|uniref:DUF397 domain-containing protein n=1 Tax=Catellatospora bangladeshensis TaxID=310355 RepID=A0A8J3NEQ0_9ACTN|nr:DUF397 domain-containing protein [Catellatospora bangladeshensis]GIF78760.1 hypothetical protein Cba03nite_01090 [Catellatospora bangladeshensis]